MTMPTSVLQVMEAHPSFYQRTGESAATIAAAEAALGAPLPAEHVELLAAGAGAIAGAESQLYFFEARELALFAVPPNAYVGLAGMILFGHNGGDYLYFYDPAGELGRGSWAIFMIGMPAAHGAPAMARESAWYVAPDLRQLVERILSGQAMEDGP